MTIRVTITKPGVTDAYGIAMVVGTTYTVGDDFGLSLISQGRATDTDDFLEERVNAPFDEVVYPVFPDGFSPVGLSADGTSLVSGDGELRFTPASGGGWQKMFGNTPSPATAFSFANQIPSRPAFVGVQLGFLNMGTSTYTISGAKVAVPPTAGNAGTGLTWVDATFDGGVSSSSTPKVIAAGSGASANVVPGGFTATDVIPLVSVARTDTPGNPYLLQTRTYISTNSNLHQAQPGGIAAYVTETGLEYGSAILPGDQVTTTGTGLAPIAGGTWICPTLVKFFYEASTINVAGCGDSLTRGQGSTTGASSGEEIACRQLTSAASVYSYINLGVSGQTLAASYATAVALLNSEMVPNVLVWKAFSPNDAYTQANFDAAYLYLLRLIDLCRTKRAVLIVRNAQRWSQSVETTARIEAFNTRIAKLSNVLVNDDYGILSEGATDPTKNLLAYSVSAGDPHLSDLGYAALAASLKRLIGSVLIG